MKKVMFAILFMSAATLAGAQGRNDLKGPAAKNYKAWTNKTQTEQNIVMKSQEAQKAQGPVAKNNKVRSEAATLDFVQVAVVSEKSSLKGPAAKNTKVWSTDANSYSVLVKKDTENHQK